MYNLEALRMEMESWCHRNACGYGTKKAARRAWAQPRLNAASTRVADLEKSLKEEGISTEMVRSRVKVIRKEKAVRDFLIGLVVV